MSQLQGPKWRKRGCGSMRHFQSSTGHVASFSSILHLWQGHKCLQSSKMKKLKWKKNPYSPNLIEGQLTFDFWNLKNVCWIQQHAWCVSWLFVPVVLGQVVFFIDIFPSKPRSPPFCNIIWLCWGKHQWASMRSGPSSVLHPPEWLVVCSVTHFGKEALTVTHTPPPLYNPDLPD